VPYKTIHAAALLDVSKETIRIWAEEFAEYLSSLANPGKNKQRLFSDEDIQVFSLVAEITKQGLTYAEAHASLKNGSRGDLPSLQPSDVQHIVGVSEERRLALENDRLQYALVRMNTELEEAKRQLMKVREIENENVRLGALLQAGEKERERLEAQIAQLTKRVEEVARDAGREYTKGFREGLHEQQEKETDDIE